MKSEFLMILRAHMKIFWFNLPKDIFPFLHGKTKNYRNRNCEISGGEPCFNRA